jgi:hypothetical protein
MSYDYDYNVDVKKDFELNVDVSFETDVNVDVKIDKDIDIDLDLCDLKGNAATLSLDVQALGDDGLTEVASTILVNDHYSSITVEAGAYVA